MMKAWLLDEMFRFHRAALTVEGSQGEWGAGDSIAEEEELPPAPANVAAKCGNGRITITWDPVPDAMYYNLYFQTTKGVQIKFSELTRPIAGPEDFKTVIGVKKEKATCLEGAQSPFVHDDLANGSCYHYVVTVVTPKGESPESQEVMAIPSPYLLAACIGQEGVDEGEFSSPTGITLDKEGNLYVADTDNHSIQKFDKTGKFVARWGGEPSAQEGNFYYPRGLAVGANDAVYVADSGNNRVQKFDLDGNRHAGVGKIRICLARRRHGQVRCALGRRDGSGRQSLRFRYEQCPHSKIQSGRHASREVGARRKLRWSVLFPAGCGGGFRRQYLCGR